MDTQFMEDNPFYMSTMEDAPPIIYPDPSVDRFEEFQYDVTEFVFPRSEVFRETHLAVFEQDIGTSMVCHRTTNSSTVATPGDASPPATIPATGNSDALCTWTADNLLVPTKHGSRSSSSSHSSYNAVMLTPSSSSEGRIFPSPEASPMSRTQSQEEDLSLRIGPTTRHTWVVPARVSHLPGCPSAKEQNGITLTGTHDTLTASKRSQAPNLRFQDKR